MKLFYFFYFLIYFEIISSIPIELKSYSEIELTEGFSEYIYNIYYPYKNNYIKYDSPHVYLFIKISNYTKILKINEIIKLSKHDDKHSIIIPDQNSQWICSSIKNYRRILSIIYQFNTTEKTKMKFFDSTQILNLNLKQFLNLHINTTELDENPYPLLFNIKSDSNVLVSIDDDYKYRIFNGYYILNYCSVEENNKCEFIAAYNIYLVKNKNYIFRLNYYEYTRIVYLYNNLKKTEEKKTEIKGYFFQKFIINYYIEEIYMKNNSFIINDFTRHNYLLLNIQNFTKIIIYLKVNPEFFNIYHSIKTISKDNWHDFINPKKYYINKNNIYYALHYRTIESGKLTILNKTLNDDYLLIKLIDGRKINKENGFILFFNEMYEINKINWSKEIHNDTHCLLKIKMDFKSTCILISSNTNMKLLYKSNNDDFTNKIILNNIEESYIFINSSQDKTFVNCKFYTNSDFYNYKLITQNDINYILNKYNSDNFFIRKIYNKEKKEFFSYYFLDIQEKYYIYIKKYFGIFDLYKYKKPLNLYSNITELLKPISYYDEQIYETVNNKLLILTGTQFFNYYINYGTFFDFLIQKVNDNNYIEINIEINNYSKSIFKLIEPNKNYYIKFELNHLIKLDNNFLDAEIIIKNKNGIKYILNKDNKIINLVGSDLTLESNKLALIYFYEKIEDITKSSLIEFNKYNTGKNMEVNITNKNDKEIKIAIAKDFGFKDCYPIIDFNSLEIYTILGKKTINLYFENYYDLLETDIYNSQNEGYYIYIFEVQNNNKLVFINKNNITISSIEYYDSLTKYNKIILILFQKEMQM